MPHDCIFFLFIAGIDVNKKQKPLSLSAAFKEVNEIDF